MSRRMAAWVLVATALCACACSGCGQLLSIGPNAVVLGVALDTAEAGITATVQMYHHGGPTGQAGGGGGGGAAGGGGGGGSTSQPIVLTLQGSGPDFAQAMLGIQAQTDVRMGFWTTDLVLIGQSLARAGVRGPLDGLLRDGNFSLRAQVAVVEGDAGKLLQAPQPAGTAVELGERLKKSASTNSGSIPIAFWRFMARATTTYRGAWAPVLVQTAQGYSAAGTAVFRGDRLAGVLGPHRSRALGWILRTGGFEPLSLETAGTGLVTLDVVGHRVHLRLDGPDSGTITLTLMTRVHQAPGLTLRATSSPRTLEAEASAEATRQLRAAVTSLQADGADVLGFGSLERQRDPAAVAGWPQVFSRMHIALDVTVRIQPGGRLA